MLESSLGVPFFTKLEAVSKLRLATLNDGDANEYIGTLMGGMQNKHDWISIEWSVHFCHRILGAERFKRVMNHPQTEDDDGSVGSHIFDDLLTALGRTERKYDDEMGALMSLDDIMALDKVFRGERFSLAELGEHVRRKETEFKRNKESGNG
jgi:hypothetical protein